MKDADTNGDGMISFMEFLGYFQKMARYRADLARTQRLESYGRPRDLPPSKTLLFFLPSGRASSSSSSSLLLSFLLLNELDRFFLLLVKCAQAGSMFGRSAEAPKNCASSSSFPFTVYCQQQWLPTGPLPEATKPLCMSCSRDLHIPAAAMRMQSCGAWLQPSSMHF